MTRLVHYSEKPLTLETLHPVKQMNTFFNYKPRGLWFSPEGEDDWLHWCHSEHFGLESLIHGTEIVLRPKAPILRVDTLEKFDQFEEQYLHKTPLGDSLYPSERLDWEGVASRYGGILIVPYFWQKRLSESMWYYGWDCASGCIWDPDIIERLSPIVYEMEKTG